MILLSRSPRGTCFVSWRGSQAIVRIARPNGMIDFHCLKGELYGLDRCLNLAFHRKYDRLNGRRDHANRSGCQIQGAWSRLESSSRCVAVDL